MTEEADGARYRAPTPDTRVDHEDVQIGGARRCCRLAARREPRGSRGRYAARRRTIIEIYTDADASAVLNARIAALRTVLDLSSGQQKLWLPVEDAIRSIAADAMARGKQRSEAAAPTDFLEVIERIGDAEATRAADLESFVAAARPLVASLSDAQKNRMPAFLGMGGTATAPLSSESFWLFEEEER